MCSVCSGKPNNNTDENTIGNNCPHKCSSPDSWIRTRSNICTDETCYDTKGKCNKESLLTRNESHSEEVKGTWIIYFLIFSARTLYVFSTYLECSPCILYEGRDCHRSYSTWNWTNSSHIILEIYIVRISTSNSVDECTTNIDYNCLRSYHILSKKSRFSCCYDYDIRFFGNFC